MISLWRFIGKTAYFICRPLILLYVKNSHRTRLLVVVGDEVLVVKGWLGDGSWQLPGGGLGRNELPAIGAARELLEETGIIVSPDNLKPLFFKRQINYNRAKFYVTAYLFKTETKPKTKKQLLEIAEIGWVNYLDLMAQQTADSDIKAVLEAFDN